MFTIGICDDETSVRSTIREICTKQLHGMKIENQVFEFHSGEEVIERLGQNEMAPIDLLFLDIEMDGISGIELRDRLVRNQKIMRIVFVTSHKEQMGMAFGLKTVGFLSKPVVPQDIIQKMEMVYREKLDYSIIQLSTIHNSSQYSVSI